jgi:hypothetical protein
MEDLDQRNVLEPGCWSLKKRIACLQHQVSLGQSFGQFVNASHRYIKPNWHCNALICLAEVIARIMVKYFLDLMKRNMLA